MQESPDRLTHLDYHSMDAPDRISARMSVEARRSVRKMLAVADRIHTVL